MGTYVSTTERETKEMLEVIGQKTVDGLFCHIPEEVKTKGDLNLPKGISELEVRKKMENLAAKNIMFSSIFRGAGAYNHYIPSIVKNVAAKEEFVTAYTPYQAEISQGILQSIFEYQTMICQLTGMDSSNASVYDGATAAAEAIAMCKERKREKAYISATAHPDVIATVKTYCFGNGIELILVPEKDGVTDEAFLNANLYKAAACLYIQQPNYYGIIENAALIGEAIHSVGGKYIIGANPISLGALKSPKEYGADIAVGEGQPLGLPLAFGGPYLGFMACVEAMTRKLPGRIVGETKDLDGKRAYVLTLQAREQHIRREKASSNICSNQALCALTAAVYMATMGSAGIYQVAIQSRSKAQYMADKLGEIGFDLVYNKEFFNEFVTTSPGSVKKALSTLESNGILGGFPLTGDKEGTILWCCTEMNSKDEIDQVIKILKEV
ncbi:MAG TPA: aminomethyl-transferring glycine dehydrogenase subunit GcvPA [Ruminiclostridium sp.]